MTGSRPWSRRVVVGRQVARVLAVGGPHLADGRDAERKHVAVRADRVALEVARKRAAALRAREFVVGQGEVVHADVDVAGAVEEVDGARHDRKLLRGARQVDVEDAPLRLEALRQVGVAVEGDAVGAKLQHALHRVGEARHALFRQAVDQVDVERLEAARARGRDHVARHLVGLDAVHRALHRRVEVLHAEARAVETEFREEADGLRRARARVDLDRVFAVRA